MAFTLQRSLSQDNQDQMIQEERSNKVTSTQSQLGDRRWSLPDLHQIGHNKRDPRYRTKRFQRHSLMDTFVPEEESSENSDQHQLPQKIPQNSLYRRSSRRHEDTIRRHSDIVRPKPNLLCVDELDKKRRSSIGMSEFSALSSHLEKSLKSSLTDVVICIRCGKPTTKCIHSETRRITSDQHQPISGSLKNNNSGKSRRITSLQNEFFDTMSSSDDTSDDGFCDEDAGVDVREEMRDSFSDNLLPFPCRRLRAMTE